MNRSLALPAVGCLLAFAALLLTFHTVVGKEQAARTQRLAAAARQDVSARLPTASLPQPRSVQPKLANDTQPLTTDEGQQLLTTLSGEYLRPWRQWETSPHRLYSRAMPRPIPSMSAEVAMSPATEDESCLFATIEVRTGAKSQMIACVVDRNTKQSRMFADGVWLTQDQWLKQAPLPSAR